MKFARDMPILLLTDKGLLMLRLAQHALRMDPTHRPVAHIERVNLMKLDSLRYIGAFLDLLQIVYSPN